MMKKLQANPNWKCFDIFLELFYTNEDSLKQVIKVIFLKLWKRFMCFITKDIISSTLNSPRRADYDGYPSLVIENMPGFISVQTLYDLKFIIENCSKSSENIQSEGDEHIYASINDIFHCNIPNDPFDIIAQFPIRVLGAKKRLSHVIIFLALLKKFLCQFKCRDHVYQFPCAELFT